MSTTIRPVKTHVMICDLCDEVIPETDDPIEKGSLTHGYIAHRVTNATKRVWLIWPSRRRLGPPVTERHYDFHAACIGRLVEDAVAARTGAPR